MDDRNFAIIKPSGLPDTTKEYFPMSIVINTKTYTADSYQKDAVSYVGPAKTSSVKDDVRIARVLPKPTTVFSGVSRQQAKLTRTLVLTGAKTLTGDLILSVDASVPVGASLTDIETALVDNAAFLAMTIYKDSVKKGIVNLG